MSLKDKLIEVFNNSRQKGMLLSVSDIIKKMCKNALDKYPKRDDIIVVSLRFISGKFYFEQSGTKLDRFLKVANSDLLLSYGDDDRLLVQVSKQEDDEYSFELLEHICNVKLVYELLEKLEQSGFIYKKREQYRLFPNDLNFVQSTISVNDKNEGYINLDDGSVYIVHPNDMMGILNGDTVVAKPIDKTYRGYRMAKIDKIIKRNDGVLIVEVIEKKGKKAVVARNCRLDNKIILEGVTLDSLSVGTKLKVKIGDLASDKCYHVEVLDTILSEEKQMSLSSPEVVVAPEKIISTDKDKLFSIVQSFFADSDKKFTLLQIQKMLNGKLFYTVPDLKEILKGLEIDGTVYLDGKGYYRAFPKSLGYVHGIIHINKHDEGIVEVKDGRKFKIAFEDLCDSLNGDMVVLKTSTSIKDGYIMATVEKIVSRKDGLVVVEVVRDEHGEFILRPFNARLSHKIKIANNSMKPLVEGDRIVVKIDELAEKDFYYGEFVKNIGHKDDPDADLQVIAIENNIVVNFSLEALHEAELIAGEVSEDEKVGRLDLTDKLVFTIDGAKTKDRDDAVSIEVNEKGNYVVGVHISDVTHYIYPGMKLWDEALARGTSVYMADTVIPMLPHKISNGICSLNENVDRLTFSCIMEVSPSGDIISYDFVDSFINSRKAMTYDDVNKVLENGELVDGYEEFYDTLKLMERLSAKLEKKKEKRGYVNFGSNDIEIEMDETGKPLEFKQREQKTAEKIIENLMLLANECYATYVVIPTPLRVHECPEEEKVAQAFETLDKSGIRVKAMNDIINGKVIQQILSQIEDMGERKVAANIILRSMQRARYDVERLGHFGLGLANYGHFTSPIRRAADLRGHYNLRMQRDNRFSIKDMDEFHEMMAEFCQHISIKEKNADQAERDANEFKMIQYMAEHIGEKFNARVTYISGKMIFVKTEQGIDGRLYPSDIIGDHFTYNDETLSFIGKHSKKRIKIGTNLVLTALEADRDFGSISFGITSDDLKLIKSRKKGA